MNLIEALIGELQHEVEKTRKILAIVPYDKSSWKPHEKSMTVEGIARHIADMYAWVPATVDKDQLDFATDYVPTEKIDSTEKLLQRLDTNFKLAIESLKNSSEEKLAQNWTMRNGDQIFFTLPKSLVLRDMVLNHIVHHRGQLTVYLRLLDLKIPGIYGPSADERP
jgi:uncharacterized damage-inducible protein DinB